MISLVLVSVLVFPLPGFSKNIIKANASHIDLSKMEPEFYSNDICGDPECDLVCSGNQVGDDCCEDLVHNDHHRIQNINSIEYRGASGWAN